MDISKVKKTYNHIVLYIKMLIKNFWTKLTVENKKWENNI